MLDRLPAELVCRVFALLELPKDKLRLSATCRRLSQAVYSLEAWASTIYIGVGYNGFGSDDTGPVVDVGSCHFKVWRTAPVNGVFRLLLDIPSKVVLRVNLVCPLSWVDVEVFERWLREQSEAGKQPCKGTQVFINFSPRSCAEGKELGAALDRLATLQRFGHAEFRYLMTDYANDDNWWITVMKSRHGLFDHVKSIRFTDFMARYTMHMIRCLLRYMPTVTTVTIDEFRYGLLAAYWATFVCSRRVSDQHPAASCTLRLQTHRHPEGVFKTLDNHRVCNVERLDTFRQNAGKAFQQTLTHIGAHLERIDIECKTQNEDPDYFVYNLQFRMEKHGDARWHLLIEFISPNPEWSDTDEYDDD